MEKEQKEKTPSTDVSEKSVAVGKAHVNDNIDAFIEKRTAFIEKVNAICVEGKDYHVIQGKKSLAKGGAEKIASIFNWQSKFEKDSEALEMLGNLVGLVAFKCTLSLRGKFIGEGRGAATLSKNAGDPNKTLKMAQKSAFIDAVLRSSGLSDFFMQDIEDMNPQDISQPHISQPKTYNPGYAKRAWNGTTAPREKQSAFQLWSEAINKAQTSARMDAIRKEIELVKTQMTLNEVETLRNAFTNKLTQLSHARMQELS